MKRNGLIRLATAICLCTAPFSAQAHHSYGMFYDLCTSVTVEGRVESVQWKIPHVLIDLRTGEGEVHRAEWTGPQNLTAAGVAADVLKTGDRIVVAGSPRHDHVMPRDTSLIAVSALTRISRASDGWNWTRDSATPPPECVRK